jgi:hypothetical protein
MQAIVELIGFVEFAGLIGLMELDWSFFIRWLNRFKNN